MRLKSYLEIVPTTFGQITLLWKNCAASEIESVMPLDEISMLRDCMVFLRRFRWSESVGNMH
jgi:hypothetical protein